MITGGYLSIIYRQRQTFLREKLRDLDVSITEYPLFLILDQNEGLGCNEISKNYFINKSLVSKSICKLLTLGYLEQKKDINHKQKVKLYLTSEGKNLVPKIKEFCKEWEEKMMEDLDIEEKKIFLKLLKKIYKNSLEYKL